MEAGARPGAGGRQIVSLERCAGVVETGDPDRWRAVMAAPVAARPGLIAIYALNLEVARAAWVASDPMIARIRLQWWVDAIGEIYAGEAPRPHDVLQALAPAIGTGALPQALFDGLIDARVFDAGREPHLSAEEVWRWLDRTAGHVMELAARHLGCGEAGIPVVREFARGAGMATLLRALPALRAASRDPLPEGVDEVALAREALAAMARARAQRRQVPRAAAPAMLSGWVADRRLSAFAAGEAPEVSAFAARSVLLLRAATGRW